MEPEIKTSKRKIHHKFSPHPGACTREICWNFPNISFLGGRKKARVRKQKGLRGSLADFAHPMSYDAAEAEDDEAAMPTSAHAGSL
jgi:hypothetical protein